MIRYSTLEKSSAKFLLEIQLLQETLPSRRTHLETVAPYSICGMDSSTHIFVRAVKRESYLDAHFREHIDTHHASKKRVILRDLSLVTRSGTYERAPHFDVVL